MSKKIPCEVIRDLLPSYVDGISSEVSNHMIEEHLKECEECTGIYTGMQMPEEDLEGKEEQQREIDIFKKVKRRNRMVIGSVILAAMVIIVVSAFFMHSIYGGAYILNNIDYQVNVSGDKLCIEGKAPEDFVYYSSDSKIVSKGDVIWVRVVCKKRTIFSRIGGEHFKIDYKSKEKIRKVIVNGDILWQDGSQIAD